MSTDGLISREQDQEYKDYYTHNNHHEVVEKKTKTNHTCICIFSHCNKCCFLEHSSKSTRKKFFFLLSLFLSLVALLVFFFVLQIQHQRRQSTNNNTSLFLTQTEEVSKLPEYAWRVRGNGNFIPNITLANTDCHCLKGATRECELLSSQWSGEFFVVLPVFERSKKMACVIDIHPSGLYFFFYFFFFFVLLFSFLVWLCFQRHTQ